MSAFPSRSRSAEELRESVMDIFVDKYLAGEAPENLMAWAKVVLRSVATKSGSVADRKRIGIDVETQMSAPEITERPFSRWREKLKEIEPKLLPTLSEEELRAYVAILDQPTIKGAARQCDWTPRDLRVRLTRIAAKARKLSDK